MAAQLPMTLYPNRIKSILSLCASLSCVGINTLASEIDHTSPYIGNFIFAVVAVFFAMQLLPAAAYLQINSKGFGVAVFFKRVELLWSDLDEIATAMYGKRKVVLLKYAQSYKNTFVSVPPLTMLTTLRYKMNRIGEAWHGWDAALPDNYGMKADELAELMNNLRKMSSMAKT
ncbi:MAG TPA: hypothetical protein VGT99_04800 [Gammaproteobacteria bacterium]|nr:hypothetical protein [Gammaproteobacteria bacterium]